MGAEAHAQVGGSVHAAGSVLGSEGGEVHVRSSLCSSRSRLGVAVQDFGNSWTSGLAFLAVIKSIDPSLVDMRKALLRTPRENLEDAFRTAHYSLGIPRLLEPEGDKG